MSSRTRTGGRDEEYSAFVAGRWSRLVGAAILIGCDLPEAEDLVQAAMLKCYVSWSKVSKADDQDAYVYRILVNTFRSARRRRSSREQPTGAGPEISTTTDEYGDVDMAASVERALSELSLGARQVVILRYFADLSERQTAAVLGIPPGTVKSRLSRALSQLETDQNLADLPGWSTT